MFETIDLGPPGPSYQPERHNPEPTVPTFPLKRTLIICSAIFFCVIWLESMTYLLVLNQNSNTLPPIYEVHARDSTNTTPHAAVFPNLSGFTYMSAGSSIRPSIWIAGLAIICMLLTESTFWEILCAFMAVCWARSWVRVYEVLPELELPPVILEDGTVTEHTPNRSIVLAGFQHIRSLATAFFLLGLAGFKSLTSFIFSTLLLCLSVFALAIPIEQEEPAEIEYGLLKGWKWFITGVGLIVVWCVIMGVICLYRSHPEELVDNELLLDEDQQEVNEVDEGSNGLLRRMRAA